MSCNTVNMDTEVANLKKRMMEDSDEEEQSSKKSCCGEDSVIDNTDDVESTDINDINIMFNQCRAKVASTDNTDNELDDSEFCEFLSIEEYKNSRLNIRTDEQSLKYSKYTMTMEYFVDTLKPLVKHLKLYECIEKLNNDDTKIFTFLHNLLMNAYRQQLECEDEINNVALVINGVIKHKRNLLNTLFLNRISDMCTKSRSLMFDDRKLDSSLKNIINMLGLDDDEDDDKSTKDDDVVMSHFPKEWTWLYVYIKEVLKCCANLHSFVTVKDMGFKSMRSGDYTSKSGDKGENKVRPALYLTLTKPILVNVTTTNIKVNQKQVAIIAITEEHTKIIKDKIEEAMFFKDNKNKRVKVRYFPGINVGEHVDMICMSLYDNSNNSIQKVDKSEFTKNPDHFIIIDELILFLNDNTDSLGISTKCWPRRITTKDVIGNDRAVTLFNFGFERNSAYIQKE